MSQLYKYLILFIAANGLIYGQETPLENTMNNLFIRKTLQEASEQVFFSRSIRLELLKDCQEVIPTLAQWLYDPDESTASIENLEAQFRKQLNEDIAPLTIAIFKEGFPIGFMSIERNDETDFDIPWIIGMYVVPEEEKAGLDLELATVLRTITRQLSLPYEKPL